MSYQRGTTHFNLPQTIGTDKRDWSDTNQAFADVDAALYQAQQDASGAATDVSAVATRVGTLESKMSTAEGNITTLQASDATQDTTLLQHGQAITALQGKVTTLEATTPTKTVQGNGVKTRAQVVAELLTGVTITRNSKIVVTDENAYDLVYHVNDDLLKAFSNMTVFGGSGAVRIEVLSINENVRYTLNTNGTIGYQDMGASTVPTTQYYKFYQ